MKYIYHTLLCLLAITSLISCDNGNNSFLIRDPEGTEAITLLKDSSSYIQLGDCRISINQQNNFVATSGRASFLCYDKTQYLAAIDSLYSSGWYKERAVLPHYGYAIRLGKDGKDGYARLIVIKYTEDNKGISGAVIKYQYPWHPSNEGSVIIIDYPDNPNNPNDPDTPDNPEDPDTPDNPDNPTPNIQAVDLGLSVKWADRNIGADSPESYGGYYAWGEITTKTEYTWDNYKFCTSSNYYTKYNTQNSFGPVDNLMFLEKQDDVAYQTLGGKWRMPTATEWNELIDNCTWQSTTINNIRGMKVIGPNGKSIFLPAAGHKYWTSYYGEGTNCDYWSSMLLESYPHDACGIRNQGMHTDERYNGFSVRAVCQ